ncbi:hypothetical protein FKW77_004598 [Venturia effusa]|uniref:Acyltransferase 3 domain-containing protein n=1 Tax=Venturia effusa TaxID=50376 RepID=A0A517KZD3_9PEZI|nr:hypothetical protein FKW77_004598 [Venturia effusa]
MIISTARRGWHLLSSTPKLSTSSPNSILTPSFLHQRAANTKVSPTAWLDGMRGIAAFLVYIRHFAAATHPDIQYGWGTNGRHRNFIHLPFIRLLTAGPAMVALFFIISGYALSLGPLKAIQHQSADAGLVRLSSATFRRAARLFLPGVVSTFIVMLCISLGLYGKGRASMTLEDMPGFHEPQPPLANREALGFQFNLWLLWTWRWFNVWNPINHVYDVHLWTLPVEFRSSMVLFMALVAFARTRPQIRLTMLFGCVVYCHYTNAWESWLFFAGSFLAQLKLLQDSPRASLPLLDIAEIKCEPLQEESTSKRDHVRILAFVLGLYLLSYPDIVLNAPEDQDPEVPLTPPCAPGYCLIANLSSTGWGEPFRFPHCIGALLTVYATSSSQTSSLRSLFDNPFSVYLGRISFALYLVHGPIIHMLGFWLVPWCWRWTGKETLMQKETGFGCAFVVVTVLVVWAADVFWRTVDQKCVAFARWCEDFVMVVP